MWKTWLAGWSNVQVNTPEAFCFAGTVQRWRFQKWFESTRQQGTIRFTSTKTALCFDPSYTCSLDAMSLIMSPLVQHIVNLFTKLPALWSGSLSYLHYQYCSVSSCPTGIEMLFSRLKFCVLSSLSPQSKKEKSVHIFETTKTKTQAVSLLFSSESCHCFVWMNWN